MRQWIKGWIVNVCIVIALALSACGINPNSEGETPAQPASTPIPATGRNYPNDELLVETGWLSARLDDDNIRILDVRDADSFRAGHIPGAVHLPIGDIVESVKGIPFEFEHETVETALRKVGLTPEMTVVIYDDLGMMSAARVFWTLEYVGHQHASVLDGGWNAWEEAGLGISTDSPEVVPSDFELSLDLDKLIDAESLVSHLDDPGWVIVDARSPQEYVGEVRLADRGGHIPGAVNLVWLDMLSGGNAVYTIESGWQQQLQDPDVERLKSAAEIQGLLLERGISPDLKVVTYCQTFWRGAHLYFVLRLMGYENVSGYDGSWAEWGNRSDLPVEE